ncbi:MAG: hypothetical protein JXA33_09325 [Anaerolineae bacterium]|nr:hypothetical protein [Anaerolineae bacterium]
MANAKIRLKLGELDFTSEGEATWVAAQLDKILNRLPAHFVEASSNVISRYPEISVAHQDVVAQPCDILILKYAQTFYGADRVVSQRLMESGTSIEEMQPQPGQYRLLPTDGIIAARQVLFVGVENLGGFGCPQIRDFAESALSIAAQEAPEAIHLAMTIHGVGYGMDEREVFTAQLSGLLAAIRKQAYPQRLEQITIVEHNQERALRLQQILNESLVVL